MNKKKVHKLSQFSRNFVCLHRYRGLLQFNCGELCPATIRWMGESVLMSVVSSPGITLKEICFRLEFALQAAAVHDLVTVLKEAGCVQEVEEVFENMTLSSPFQKQYSEEVIVYLLPVAGCFETFARIFGG
ncbi:unnamed protein product [Strongylus vulgaris]|uniref:Uncharacterized protein n=1 Tax=Strongylus vulgaris TaxID=40348 RepID=A0A3P7IME5_STRVU|nr:unnamed protein product [Strongylus vulgaris]